MNLDYNTWLSDQLTTIKEDLELDVNIAVEDEQMFLKHNVDSDTIYVVIKYLGKGLELNIEVQPIQMLILSEANQLDKAKILFNKFATDWNYKTTSQSSEYIKHQYSSPVVLSNFNDIANNYRSVLYMSGTLYILSSVADLETLTIDSESITPLSFNISYSMSGNTQQTLSNYISTTEKNISTFNVVLSVPLVSTSSFVIKILNIIDEVNTGNDTFAFSIKLKGRTNAIAKSMKLISATINTAPNQAPTLQLGFMR